MSIFVAFAFVSPIAWAEDETDLENFEVDEGSFSLDNVKGSNEASNNGPLENFSTIENNTKLNLGVEEPEPVSESQSSSLPDIVPVQEVPVVTSQDMDEAPPVPPSVVSESVVDPVATVPIVGANDFGGAPYIPGGRRVMANGEAPEYYKVERGDTLYDICDQLIDEADYWPKLWAMNPGIKNPHFIFPNMTLSFYPGDDTNPPFLQIVAENDIIPLETGGLTEADLVAQPIEQSQLEEIPTTFEDVRNVIYDVRDLKANSDEFEAIGDIHRPENRGVEIPAFYFEEEPRELGQVVSGPQGEVHVAENDKLIIDADSGDLQNGSLYSVVRPQDSEDVDAESDFGDRYEFVAHIRVAGYQGGTYLAQVVRSRLGVRPDDWIIDYRSTKRIVSTDLNADISQSDESIVGFEFDRQFMAGQNQLVFISGKHAVGTQYAVYQSTDLRIPQLLQSAADPMMRKIAVIKVIEEVGDASLAIVLSNHLDIRIGDRLKAVE